MKKYLYSLATDQINTPFAAFMKIFLSVASFLYALGVRAILLCYEKNIFKAYHLKKPVISIGNITLGGVGKTPLVVSIVHYLKQKGLRPAVLTRGYMANKTSGSKTSDEVLLLQSELADVPVFVGGDRIASGQKALKEYSVDVFVLDDGFQHWRLSRDLDIVAVDVTNPFGNKCTIPRGVLREPIKSLKRADIFVITRADVGEENLESVWSTLSAINQKAIIAEAFHQPVALHDIIRSDVSYGPAFLSGKRCCAFCSIGNPGAFEQSLIRLGADLKKNFSFIDHYRYTKEDIRQIADFCKTNNIDIIVTTGKDAVKLKNFVQLFGTGVRLFSLDIALEITKGKNEVLERVSSICNS